MPIFNSPYDTTVLAGAVMNETIRSLKACADTGSTEIFSFRQSEYDDPINIHTIQGGTSTIDTIRYFNHPIMIVDGDIKDISNVEFFVDVRNFGRYDQKTDTFIVRNKVEYKLMIMRAIINHLWLTRKKQIFRDMTYLPMKLFAGSISESIRRTYQLDPGAQIQIAVLCAYYYYGLFADTHEFTDYDKQRVISQVVQATSAPSTIIEDMISDLKIIDNIVDLCEVIKDKVNNVRLDDFNQGILIAAMSNIWNGTNAREIIPIAFEHPPTWLMIVYSCIDEATYTRSALGKLAHSYNKGDTANTFVSSINSLFGGAKNLKEAFE